MVGNEAEELAEKAKRQEGRKTNTTTVGVKGSNNV
jgi:hypothetical protein